MGGGKVVDEMELFFLPEVSIIRLDRLSFTIRFGDRLMLAVDRLPTNFCCCSLVIFIVQLLTISPLDMTSN